ncbi:MAG: two-component system, chemotaxis family, sensor kinase CheA [Frankiales bacterium]|nr:two-component system, chemotaxis family, sensor kinase CheA [Frankiales bacterium]
MISGGKRTRSTPNAVRFGTVIADRGGDTDRGVRVKVRGQRDDAQQVAGWTVDDPELIATFRAEVEERLASLQAGLLHLEGSKTPRQAIAGLFRDAHTVKGSARMLGLDGVLQLAHTSEDLLGALRDGRFVIRRDLIDLLLAACDAIGRAIPGAPNQLADSDLAPMNAVLKRALAGEDNLTAPPLSPVETELEDPEDSRRTGSDSVRVSSEKVYGLLDIVGEAELGARRVEQTSAKLLTMATDHAKWTKVLRDSMNTVELSEETALALHRLTQADDGMRDTARSLRELVEGHLGQIARVRDDSMGLAMVPVRRVFAALPRIVRDVATATGKDVRLDLVGEDVELDKQVLDGVADALKHLVINAVDHGCQTPEQRRAAGKKGPASVRVAARSSGGTVVLEVVDDGNGIDEDRVRAKAVESGLLPPDSVTTGPALWQLLFVPAFSTAGAVTETSGRGVGLDVVQSAAEELGGNVEIVSVPGRGTTFRLTLPVTLGVLRCLVARVGDEVYAVPVSAVVASMSLRDTEIHQFAGAPVIVRQGQNVPLLDLGATLGVTGERAPRAALVVRHGERQLAWAVDRLETEMELVVKELGPFLGRLPLVTGATIVGDGTVVCLLDLRELADQATGTSAGVMTPVTAGPQLTGSVAGADRAPAERRPRVLVVEDSVGVRELERVILEGAGYDVETAVDGLDGASRLGSEPADLVVSDVEMPGMDGFTLTRTIRRTKGWEQVPVVIMTSCGDDADQRAGLEAGASAYLLKQEFDQTSLVDIVRRLIGR